MKRIAQFLRDLRDAFAIFFGCWPLIAIYALLITLLVIAGCGQPPARTTGTGEMKAAGESAQLDVRAEQIISSASNISGKENQPHVNVITRQATFIREGVVKLWTALEAARSEHVSDVETERKTGQRKVEAADKRTAVAEKKTGELLRNPWVIGGLIAQKIFWTWITLLGIAIVLRIVGLFVPNAFGALLAKGATVAIGVLTGVTLITSAADNAWFNWLSPKTKKAAGQ